MTEELFTTEVTKGACPYCGYIIEAATGNGPRPPKRGDVSVCIECLNVVMFNDDLTIVKPDPETFAAVRSNTGLWAYIEFVRLTIRNIKEKKFEAQSADPMAGREIIACRPIKKG